MKKIIVADDDNIVVESIRDMLSRNYIVNTATTGYDVLKMCTEQLYDGLIIDVQFDTGISGLETVYFLREDDDNIKIILFSAISLPDEIIEQLHGMDVLFCLKPLNSETVQRIMGT